MNQQTAMDIIDAVTRIDEHLNGSINGQFTPTQYVDMGQFIQWAQPILMDDDIDMGQLIDVPTQFEWVVNSLK